RRVAGGETPYLDRRVADTSADLGSDRGVAEVQLGVVERSLGGLDRAVLGVDLSPGRDLGLLEAGPSGLEVRLGGGLELVRVVQALLRCGGGGGQGDQAVYLDLPPQQLGPRLLELGLRLDHLHLL